LFYHKESSIFRGFVHRYSFPQRPVIHSLSGTLLARNSTTNHTNQHEKKKNKTTEDGCPADSLELHGGKKEIVD